MIELYEEFKDLIFSRAWSFQRSTGHDIDELISVAKLAFFDAVKDWDCKRPLMTYAYRRIDNRLKHFVVKTDRPVEFVDANEGSSANNPSRRMAFMERLAELSSEAAYVAKLILDGPCDALGISGQEKPAAIRGAVRRHLRSIGTPRGRTQYVMQELRSAFSEAIDR